MLIADKPQPDIGTYAPMLDCLMSSVATEPIGGWSKRKALRILSG